MTEEAKKSSPNIPPVVADVLNGIIAGERDYKLSYAEKSVFVTVYVPRESNKTFSVGFVNMILDQGALLFLLEPVKRGTVMEVTFQIQR